MFHKVLFWGSFLILFIGIIFFQRFNATNDLLQKYQKIGFLQSDFNYKKATKTWDGQGIIFYQVQFPRLPFFLFSEKMLFSFDEKQIKFDLKKVHFNTHKILQQLYNEKVSEKLNTYIPYHDFEQKMIISLAVMGIEQFDGDIFIYAHYRTNKELDIKIDMVQNHQEVLSFSGTILRPIEGAVQFSDLWEGKIKNGRLSVGFPFFQKYIQYAQSRGRDLPSDITQNTLSLSEKKGLKIGDIFN